MTPTEAELQSYYDLHKRYYGELIHIGVKLGWNREDLKDIINQMFLDLIDKGVQVKSIINPKAYLHTVLHRKLIDYSRKNKKAKQMRDFFMSEDLYETGIDGKIEEEQELAEITKRIVAIYQTLPARCQKVIFLKFYEGLTTTQIAAKTGLSSRTVYNNLFEGLKRITKIHRSK